MAYSPSVFVCDVCGQIVQAVERFDCKLARGTFSWDVGPCCMDKRFAPRQRRRLRISVEVIDEIMVDR